MSAIHENPVETSEDLIDLTPVFAYVRRAAKFVLACTVVLAVIGAILGRAFLPNYYRSASVLVPVSESGGLMAGGAGLSGMLLQFGSMLGISDLAGLSGDTNGDLAVELVKTRSFAIDFLHANTLEVPLLAGQQLDPQTNTWVVDPKIYDAANQKWVSRSVMNKDGTLSQTKLFDEYRRRVLVSVSRQTNLVTVSVDSRSPAEAQRWLRLLIERVNDELRSRELNESKRNIDFLTRRAQETGVAELREAMFHIAAEQMRRMMLAEGRIDFALKVLDPPYLPEKPVRPRWIDGLLIGGGLGLVLGFSMFPLLRRYMGKTPV